MTPSPGFESTGEALTCEECRSVATSDAAGWRAYLVGNSHEMDSEEMVAVYCPGCAEREFDD